MPDSAALEQLRADVHALREEQHKAQAKSTSDKVWDFVLRALVPVSLLIGGTQIAHEVRLAVIENTRFTAADGQDLHAKIAESLAQQHPPEWLSKAVSRIELGVQENSRHLRLLSERMTRMETIKENGK